MQRNPAGVSVEALLAHRGWVRALARGLAGDASSADDLEQEVWLTALRRPPLHASGIRGWLARVVRSRAADAHRSEASRGERERRSSRPEDAVASTEHLAQVAELQSRVARAVLELEEPYRSTVLLRYFEELSLEDVATRTGAPLETVRTRIRRAHERLRERLDRDHDGDRKAWVAILAPFARVGGHPAAVPVKAAVTVVALLLLVGLIGRGFPGDPSPASTQVAVTSPPAAAPLAPPPLPAPSAPPAEEPAPPPVTIVPPPPPAVAPPSAAEAPPPAESPVRQETPTPVEGVRVHGRVIDDRRRPIAAATVTFGVPGFVDTSSVSDASGTFELRVPRRQRHLGPSNAVLRAVAPDGRVGLRVTGRRFEDSAYLHEIVVHESRALEIRVLDAIGPVAGADVLLWTWNACAASATTGSDGLARLAPLPSKSTVAFGARPLLLLARAEARGSGETVIRWPSVDEGPVVVRLTSKDRSVQVVDAATGAGIEGAELRIHQRYDEEDWNETVPDFSPRGSLRTGPGGLAKIRGLSAEGQFQVVASAEGYGDPDSQAWIRFNLATDRPTRIPLARTRTIRWPISDREGPVPPHGSVVRLHWGSRTQSALSAGHGWTPPIRPVSEGRIEVSRSDGARVVVDGLGGGPMWDGRSLGVPGLLAVAPDGRQARLTVPRDSDTDLGPSVSFRIPRSVTVEVRDERERPRPGVEVLVEGSARDGRGSPEYALTDEGGRARISNLWGGSVTVRLRDPHLTEFEPTVAGKADLEEGDARIEAVLPVRHPVECLVRIRVNGEPRLPPELRVYVNQGRNGMPVEGLIEDPQEGAVRFTAWLLRPEEPFQVSAHGYGLMLHPVEIPAGRRDGAVEAVLLLESPPPAAAPAPRPTVPNPPLEGESRDQWLLRVLDTTRLSFSLEKSALPLALQYISAAAGINVLLDNDVEREFGAAEVTVKVMDYTVRDAILEVLKSREELGIVLRDGCVVVVKR